MALRIEDAFGDTAEENDLVQRILQDQQRPDISGGRFLRAGELLSNINDNNSLNNFFENSSNFTSFTMDYNSQFAPYEQDISGNEVDSDLRIVFDVKEALGKYRTMKAEVAELEDKLKIIGLKEQTCYTLHRELKDNYLKLTDLLLLTETRQKYMEYEKALHLDLTSIRSKLNKEHTEYRAKIQKLKQNISEVTQLIKEGVRGEIADEDIQRMRDPNLCVICVENKVTHVFNPCGHTVCQGCIDPTLTRCHLCRRQIMNKIKIYFS
jgi:hypothetical protein